MARRLNLRPNVLVWCLVMAVCLCFRSSITVSASRGKEAKKDTKKDAKTGKQKDQSSAGLRASTVVMTEASSLAPPPSRPELALAPEAVSTGGSNSNKTSTIIFVMGCTGSTWLAELLERHPCVSSYIAKNAGPDHHFKNSRGLRGLINELNSADAHAAGQSSGILIHNNNGEISRMVSAVKSNAQYLKRLRPRVMLFDRELLFTSMCQAKKHALHDVAKKDKSACQNPNHQGEGCAIANNFSYSLPFSELKRIYGLIEADYASRAGQLADAIGALYKAVPGSNFLRLSYKEVVCAQTQVGPGRLPVHAEQFLGISPEQCSAANFSELSEEHVATHGAVKMSPPNPALALTNREALVKKTAALHLPWAEGLSRPSEVQCHHAGGDVRSPSTDPEPLGHGATDDAISSRDPATIDPEIEREGPEREVGLELARASDSELATLEAKRLALLESKRRAEALRAEGSGAALGQGVPALGQEERTGPGRG